jgi:hypothetical protein
MNKISSSIVRVKDIHSSVPRSEFSEKDLEKAALLILEMEGVVNPPIILRTGMTSYQMVDGYFEYYAALKAREINPRRGESINVYIIESEEEEKAYRKQIEVFRGKQAEKSIRHSIPNSPPIKLPKTKPAATMKVVDETQPEFRLEALEQTVNELVKVKSQPLPNLVVVLQKIISEQTKEMSHQIGKEINFKIEQLSHQIQALQYSSEIPSAIPPALNSSPTTQPIEKSSQEASSKILKLKNTEKPSLIDKNPKFLQAINMLPFSELLPKLKKAGANKNVRDNLRKERNKKQFTSIEDMMKRVNGLGSKTMDSLLNQWL